jgi:hypothetical protein
LKNIVTFLKSVGTFLKNIGTFQFSIVKWAGGKIKKHDGF